MPAPGAPATPRDLSFPRRGGWSAALAAALPLLVFVLFIAWAGARTGEGRAEAWLDAATNIAEQSTERGVPFLRLLEPVSDPRCAPAAALLILGLPAATVLVLFRATAIALAAGTIALLALRRGDRVERLLSPWLLAASPLWGAAALRGEPHISLGLLFLVIQRGWMRFWVCAPLIAWSLGWSSWAWVTLLLLPLGGLLLGAARVWRGIATLGLAALLLGVLNPRALMDPGGFFDGLAWEARIAGLIGSEGLSVVPSGGWATIAAVHAPFLLLLAVAARRWPGRLRAGNAAPLILLLVALLWARGGCASPEPLLILLPWTAGEAGGAASGVARTAVFSPRRSRARIVALFVLVLGPLVWGTLARPRSGDLARAEREALAWVEDALAAGSLVAHETGMAIPDSTRQVWLAIPYHRLDPSAYRGAYWFGWYRACSALVVGERRLSRYLREPGAHAEILNFYVAARTACVREQVFGSRPGERVHVLLLAPSGTDAFEPQWRERVRMGLGAGLPADFVAALGAGLAKGGRPAAAVELLEEALNAGYDQPAVFLNLGSAHLLLGRAYEAGRVLDEGVQRHPESPELLFNLALALTRAEIWDRAVETLLRLRRHWPRSGEAAYLQGLALANLGERRAARVALEEALRLDPRLPQRASVLEILARLKAEGT